MAQAYAKQTIKGFTGLKSKKVFMGVHHFTPHTVGFSSVDIILKSNQI